MIALSYIFCTEQIKPFQPSVEFQIETSHLICSANQITGFYMKWHLSDIGKFTKGNQDDHVN